MKNVTVKINKNDLRVFEVSHKELCNITSKWLKKHNRNIEVPNCSQVANELCASTKTGEKPDILGFCSWSSVMVEIKVERGDFLKDKKKKFRLSHEFGCGEFKYYCCPNGLIKESELPSGWGLLYLNNENKIDIIKIASKSKCNHLTERTILFSMLRRKVIAAN